MDPWRESTPCSRGPPGHRLNAACLAPIQDPYSTASHHPQHYHSPPGGGLDLRTTTNGALLQILCTLATIDYATARTADRVRINPYNNSLTISTPSEPRARLYLRVSELRLGPTSYPLRAYMAAPDNALRGIIYNAVDSQTQDEIVQDLQAMNVNTPYAIADARQMGRSQSILITFVGTTTLPSAIVFNCGIYRCHPPNPPSVTAAARLTRQSSPRPASPAASCAGEPTSRARVGASSGSTGTARRHLRPPLSLRVTGKNATHRAHPQDLSAFPPPLSLPWCPVCQPPPLRPRRPPPPTTTSPVSWKSQPHTSDPQTAALKATIAAQQLQIQELSRQLQAALARLSSPAPSPSPCPATAPSQTPSQLAPAEEPMNTVPSAASSRASSPTRHPPHKRRSPSSDDVAPERDIVRKTTSFLEAFEQRVMACFVRLKERIASVDNRVATIESHLTALDTRVAVLEARQSATEATLAHLSLPSPQHLPQLRPSWRRPIARPSSSVSPALGLVAQLSLPLNSPLLPLFPPHCPSLPTSTPC
ncbi:hypothetical protein HPB49_013729 [Dermacentor silvarum]|uniref:Uncharacterized protein n=1 Tax=Dermacentor silvarum TaxID=543639 RepID=A0ACB8E0R3_DERSI|nr:hypothetical protein HPB49_013729 [Dermacentor silvarum]